MDTPVGLKKGGLAGDANIRLGWKQRQAAGGGKSQQHIGGGIAGGVRRRPAVVSEETAWIADLHVIDGDPPVLVTGLDLMFAGMPRDGVGKRVVSIFEDLRRCVSTDVGPVPHAEESAIAGEGDR